jgi:hypothetical protein
MDINEYYTADKKYCFNWDILDQGLTIPMNLNAKGQLQENTNASYLIRGKLKVINPSRPDQIYTPSHRRIGSGAIFPGEYWIETLEESEVRCLHIQGMFDKSDYKVKETFLSTGDTLPLLNSDGVEAAAIIVGSVTDADGTVYGEGTLVDIRDGDKVFTASESTTIAHVVNLTLLPSE